MPAWTHDVSVKVNGVPAQVVCQPGTWATLQREWNSGDRVEIRIPLALHMQAVDKQHPERVAVVRGPVAMTMEGLWQETTFTLPKTDAELEQMLLADDTPGFFRVRSPAGGTNHSRFRPFYTEEERRLSTLYFDKPSLPIGHVVKKAAKMMPNRSWWVLSMDERH